MAEAILAGKMASATLLLVFLLCAPAFASAHDSRGPPPRPFFRRSNVPPEGYFSPLNNGGNMLTVRSNLSARHKGRREC